MRTENPQNLVQISYVSCGKAVAVFANPQDIAAKQYTAEVQFKGGGCIRIYKQDGQPKKTRSINGFDWTHAVLNVANIMEQSIGMLPKGWQQRALIAHEEIMRQVLAVTA